MLPMAHRGRRLLTLLVLGTLVASRAPAQPADATGPIISPEERHLAINDPDRFAWLLFVRLNRPIENDPASRVHWEGWALARDVFSNPNQPPTWPSGPAARQTQDLERLPLQQLIRALGGYFVRRNSGRGLYRRVLESYVAMAVENGVAQAVYPEGGLSRDGRLRPPKLGLIDYMLKAFDPEGPRDLLFVPVGINYDRVLEDRSLLLSLDQDRRGQADDPEGRTCPHAGVVVDLEVADADLVIEPADRGDASSVDRQRDHVEVGPTEPGLERIERGHLLAAGHAPGRPDVHEHDLATPAVERHRLKCLDPVLATRWHRTITFADRHTNSDKMCVCLETHVDALRGP